ncbi:hypothetical protein P167DRAFT_254813 [Morchella conica CCBAS932]|uniref:Uncharacterized protein n=1 Tax=Morchella conica CCBAS932 TaxID=1392247 RepID=A0A3N4KIP3_9PEZI|nr:hypothetical protein P167DRAFT_254813 [Morchella conica CCBAS932]
MAEHSIYSTSTGFHPLCLLVAPFSRMWNTPTGSRPALIPSHTPSPVHMPHLGAGYMENSPQEQKPHAKPGKEPTNLSAAKRPVQLAVDYAKPGI